MMADKIRNIMFAKKMTITKLAEKMGNISVQNLSQKLKRDNLSEKELQEIATALDANLVIELRDKATGEILKGKY